MNLVSAGAKNAAPRQGAVKALHYKNVMVDEIHTLLIGFAQNDLSKPISGQAIKK